MDDQTEQQLKDAVKANINVPGLVAAVVDGAANTALQKMVDDTATPFDNMAKDALYPVLTAEIKKQVEALWAKLLP